MDVRADYIGRYLDQHRAARPASNMQDLINRVPMLLTPRELMEVL